MKSKMTHATRAELTDVTRSRYSKSSGKAKRKILDFEGADPDGLARLARQGTRFLGSRTTRIFCLPTCNAARRIQEQNRVPFQDERAAERAGYRPCSRCRPAAQASA